MSAGADFSGDTSPWFLPYIIAEDHYTLLATPFGIIRFGSPLLVVIQQAMGLIFFLLGLCYFIFWREPPQERRYVSATCT